MSYRCEVCGAKVAPHTPRKVHTVVRRVPTSRFVAGELVQIYREEIAREIAVCEGCDYSLHTEGVPLADLARLVRQPLAAEVAEAEVFEAEAPIYEPVFVPVSGGLLSKKREQREHSGKRRRGTLR